MSIRDGIQDRDGQTARGVSARSLSPTCISAPRAARPSGCSTFCAITMPTLIYLVGDIVDGWQLQSGWYWPQAHNDVVQKLLRKARKGARIVYVPGNHDEFLRGYYGTHFGGVEVAETRNPRGRRRQALSRHPRRPFRPGGHAGALARAARQQGLRLRDLGSIAIFNAAAPAARLSLLVAVAMGEAEGEERGQLHRRVRAGAGRGGAPPCASTA